MVLTSSELFVEVKINTVSALLSIEPKEMSINKIQALQKHNSISQTCYILLSIIHHKVCQGARILTCATVIFPELELFKFGMISKGQIIAILPKSNKGVYVHYDYELNNGKKSFGESFTKDLSLLTRKKKGDFISIFISRVDEKVSCMVPKSESERNNWNIVFE